MVATGKPLGVILDGLCRLVDNLSSDSLHSILLFDPNGNCLRPVQGPAFQKAFWLRWMALRSALVWVRAERPPTAKSKSSSLTSKTSPLWANYLELARAYGLRAVGPHQSYLQMAVCWARSRFTGVNRAAQARIINRSSNRSHI